jgi:hypothetical protein
MDINITRIYVNLDGTIVPGQELGNISRGNTNKSIIELVAPFPNTERLVTTLDYKKGLEGNFESLDVLIPRRDMTLQTGEIVNNDFTSGEDWNVWQYSLGKDDLANASRRKITSLFVTFVREERTVDDEIYKFRGFVIPQGSETDLDALNQLANPVLNDYAGVGTETSTAQCYLYNGTIWDNQQQTVLEFETANELLRTDFIGESDLKRVNVKPNNSVIEEEISVNSTTLAFGKISLLEGKVSNIELAFKTQADGNLNPSDDGVFSSDKRIATHVNTSIANRIIVATVENSPFGDDINLYVSTVDNKLYNTTQDPNAAGITPPGGEPILTGFTGPITLVVGNIVEILFDTFNSVSPAYSQVSWSGTTFNNILDTSDIPLAKNSEEAGGPQDGLMGGTKADELRGLIKDVRENTNVSGGDIFDGNKKIKSEVLNISAFNYKTTIASVSELDTLGPTALAGDTYKQVGVTELFNGIEIESGDHFTRNNIIWTGDSTLAWDHIDNNDAVNSVAGKKGIVVLDILDIVNLQLALDAKAEQTALDVEATTRATNDATLQSNIDTEETSRISGDSALQTQIDGNDSDIIALQSGKEDKTNKKSTLIGNETDSNAYLNAPAIAEELNKKTDKIDNEQINSKVSGFGIDDIITVGTNQWAWAKEAIVKFIREEEGADTPPTTNKRYIKTSANISLVDNPNFDVIPDVAIEQFSGAYLYEDFTDLITQDDIDNTRLITDETKETVGEPKVKIAYATQLLPKGDEYDKVYLVVFQHTLGVIEGVVPFGIAATQAAITASLYGNAGRPIYNAEGNLLTVPNGYTVGKTEGKTFTVGGNFGGTGNQNYLASGANDTDIGSAKIYKVYPDLVNAGIDNIDTGVSLAGYSDINIVEYYNTTTETVIIDGAGLTGTKTLVSLLGFSLFEPNTFYQILPQAANTTSSAGAQPYTDLATAKTAISNGEIKIENIELLERGAFVPLGYILYQANCANFATDDGTACAVVPISEIGGTVNFVNTTGQLAADQVIATGVTGFANQELVNIE